MILTLEVTGPEANSLGRDSRHEFTTAGGLIGRARSCEWVLPHTKVSGRHAVISYLDGVFYIEDTSTNGVFINSPRNRIVQGRRYALQSGDRIFLDPYGITVAVSSEDERIAPAAGSPDAGYYPRSEDPASAPRATPRIHPARDRVAPEPVPSEEVDPLKLLGSDPTRIPAKRSAPTAQELDQSPVAGHFAPPAVVTPTPPSAPAPTPGSFIIPEGYDPLSDNFTEPPPLPPPPPVVPRPSPPPARVPEACSPAQSLPPIEPLRSTPPPTPAPAVMQPEPAEAENAAQIQAQQPEPVSAADESTGNVAALLAGAGLGSIQATPDLARTFGQIFRVVVEGVMDVLRSRQQIKDEFRMRMTQFRPADNNPLKFSANVDDALHNLLVKRNPAYLGPVEAFEDAFDDLRNHQLAMLAGMRVAFEAMLAEFDPDRLEKQFDRQLKRVPLLGSMSRLRYWDSYRDWRDELAKDPDARFKQLFGEEFARAYEEQLNRLKAEGRAKDPAARASTRSDT